MPLYTKPSKLMVYDLINEANPGLTTPVTVDNVKLGIPTVIPNAQSNSQNTRIMLSGTTTGEYINKFEVKYTRIDLALLLRSQLIEINKFSPKADTTLNAFLLSALLPDINAKYGLNFEMGVDVNEVQIPRGTQVDGKWTSTTTVTIAGGSLGYVGTFRIKWTQAPQDLEGMITTKELQGRLFPGGNDFTGVHKEIMDSVSYGFDFSSTLYKWVAYNGAAINDMLLGFSGSPSPAWTSFVNEALGIVNATFGTNYKCTLNSNGYLSTPGEFSGMRFSAVYIPGNGAPAANKSFTHVMVIKIPADCPWATGTLYLHINYPNPN
jgi:hypothetical protein